MIISLSELEKLINQCGHNLLIPRVIELNNDNVLVFINNTTRTNYYDICNSSGTRIGSMIVRFYEDIMFIQNIFIKEDFRHMGIATKTILELCRIGKYRFIIGKMVTEAIPFWIKISGDNSYRQFLDTKPNCLIPFKFDILGEDI